MPMTKQQAIEIFGSRTLDLAEALGVTKQAITYWPETLSQKQHDQVIGAAVRLGKPYNIKPSD